MKRRRETDRCHRKGRSVLLCLGCHRLLLCARPAACRPQQRIMSRSPAFVLLLLVASCCHAAMLYSDDCGGGGCHSATFEETHHQQHRRLLLVVDSAAAAAEHSSPPARHAAPPSLSSAVRDAVDALHEGVKQAVSQLQAAAKKASQARRATTSSSRTCPFVAAAPRRRIWEEAACTDGRGGIHSCAARSDEKRTSQLAAGRRIRSSARSYVVVART